MKVGQYHFQSLIQDPGRSFRRTLDTIDNRTQRGQSLVRLVQEVHSLASQVIWIPPESPILLGGNKFIFQPTFVGSI